MGTFLDRVQSEKIAGPLRRNFTIERWNRAFAGCAPHDASDIRIHEAAAIIHTKLQNIRAGVRESSSSTLSAAEKLRGYVAISNYNFLFTGSKTREAFRNFTVERINAGNLGYRAEDIFAEVKIELPGGFEFSPNEIVEGLVDGIEVPIKFALLGSPDLSGNPHMQKIAWKDFALELNLGIMFRHVEDLWDDCLWNGYGVFNTKFGKLFVPKDVDAKRAHVLGIARRNSLFLQISVSASRFHAEMVARGLRPRLRDIVSIGKEGRRQVIRVSKSLTSGSDAQEQLFALRALANDPYYMELLHEPLPALDEVTLSDVLDAWVVISRIGLLQKETFSRNVESASERREDSPSPSLSNYAPVLQIDALVQALFTAAGIPPVKARMLVDFFTYRGTQGQEIWAAPLVPIGARSVSPIFAAIDSPNLRRLVDVWMRLGGIDLEVRGPAYEQYLRSELVEGVASSPVLHGNAVAVPNDYTFAPSNGRSEQIDLLFSIGSTVFIGEAKCILEPTEAKGVANHRRTVFGAADQVLRKAQCVKDNKAEFIRSVARFGISLPDDFNVFPFVVVSSSTHVGVPANGVAVIDEYILKKYLDGELEHVGVAGPFLAVQKTIKEIFYTDLTEAEAKAPEYFSSPPQMKRLKDGITGRVAPIHAIDEDDWAGAILTVECKPLQGAEPMVEAA